MLVSGCSSVYTLCGRSSTHRPRVHRRAGDARRWRERDVRTQARPEKLWQFTALARIELASSNFNTTELVHLRGRGRNFTALDEFWLGSLMKNVSEWVCLALTNRRRKKLRSGLNSPEEPEAGLFYQTFRLLPSKAVEIEFKVRLSQRSGWSLVKKKSD